MNVSVSSVGCHIKINFTDSLSVCVLLACLCTMYVPGVHEEQKRALHLLELE